MLHTLHGTVGSYRDWSAMQEFLKSRNFEILSHDLWDYLGSNAADTHNLWSFAQQFNQSVNKSSMGVGQDLIGYSMGGRLALHVLLDQPKLWRKAVIISAHTGLAQNLTTQREERLKSDTQWAQLAANDAVPWEEFLKQWNEQGVLNAPGTASLDWYDRNLLVSNRSQIAASFLTWSLARQEDLLDRLGSLTMPILWVVGERDPKFRAIAECVDRLLPNVKLVVLPNVGHRLPWEAPSIFHQLVQEWLDR